MNLKEVKEALSNNKKSHERNVLEVRNYYNALMYLNEYSKNGFRLTSTSSTNFGFAVYIYLFFEKDV